MAEIADRWFSVFWLLARDAEMKGRSLAVAAILAFVVNGLAWGASHDPRSKIAEELDNYARHLASSGQSERASEVEEYGRAFRAAGRSTGQSVYLGFNPAAVLTEYVNALRKLKQEERAIEVRHLAKWYDCSNQYGFLIQTSDNEGLSDQETQAALSAKLPEECWNILGLRTDTSVEAGTDLEQPPDVQEQSQETGPIFKKPGTRSGPVFKRVQ